MKKMVPVFALIFSSIFGVTLSSTAFGGEFTQFGRILFQSASLFVPADKVCQNDGFLFHKTKTEVAVEYCPNDESSGNSNCKIVKKPIKPQPINSTRQRCAEYTNDDSTNCLKWETVPLVQGPVVKVDVFASDRDWQDNRAPISSFEYTIPGCL